MLLLLATDITSNGRPRERVCGLNGVGYMYGRFRGGCESGSVVTRRSPLGAGKAVDVGIWLPRASCVRFGSKGLATFHASRVQFVDAHFVGECTTQATHSCIEE